MHEASIAAPLLRLVLDELKKHESTLEGPLRVTRVRIRAGLLVAVEPATLQGCFALMAEASKTDWHSLKEIRIQFDSAQADSVEDYSWGDSWFYSVGGEYRFSDRFTFRAGVARDDSPVSLPHRTPRMPDQDRMWYSVGLTWNATPNLEVSASYTKVDMADTPKIDLVSSSGSRLVGEFDGGADILGVSAQYRF